MDRHADGDAERALVFVNLSGADQPLAGTLAAQGWQVLGATSIWAAQDLLRLHRAPVGVLVFADDGAARMEDLEDLVLGHPATEWIALFFGGRPAAPERFLRLVADACYDFHTLPQDPLRLAYSLGHALGKAALKRRFLRSIDAAGDATMVGDSVAMRDLFHRIGKAAAVDAPVLVRGESGTGKELAAQAIHRRSRRAEGPFVVVDCGALPPTLVHSELFGHEKGAFTGAHQAKKGLIESAAGGTLFIDEIGDLPLELQTNLLRFLQERTISRLGSGRKIAVDARIIAATHVDLDAAIAARRFREDLYYRLNVVRLAVPALRQRASDIELLARHFFQRFANERGPHVRGFGRGALAAMLRHAWPGNVRELMNRVRSAMAMSDHPLIEPADLGLEAKGDDSAGGMREVRALAEKNVLEETLHGAGSNISKAARALGVSRVTVYRLMDKHGLSKS